MYMSNLFSTKPLAEMSLDELRKQERSFNIASQVTFGIMIAAIVVTLIRVYLKAHFPGDTFLTFGPLFLMLFVGDKLKKIRTEISSRRQLENR